MEPYLRQLGLPTTLQKGNFFPTKFKMILILKTYILSLGVVTLLKEHTVCKEGNVLTPEEARLLVMTRAFFLECILSRLYLKYQLSCRPDNLITGFCFYRQKRLDN